MRATIKRRVPTLVATSGSLSLAKTLQKVALVGRNRSLVARTNKCGWASRCFHIYLLTKEVESNNEALMFLIEVERILVAFVH